MTRARGITFVTFDSEVTTLHPSTSLRMRASYASICIVTCAVTWAVTCAVISPSPGSSVPCVTPFSLQMLFRSFVTWPPSLLGTLLVAVYNRNNSQVEYFTDTLYTPRIFWLIALSLCVHVV